MNIHGHIDSPSDYPRGRFLVKLDLRYLGFFGVLDFASPWIESTDLLDTEQWARCQKAVRSGELVDGPTVSHIPGLVWTDTCLLSYLIDFFNNGVNPPLSLAEGQRRRIVELAIAIGARSHGGTFAKRRIKVYPDSIHPPETCHARRRLVFGTPGNDRKRRRVEEQ